MYEKIKSDTRAAFLRLYPHGTLEDVTGPVIRYLANILTAHRIGEIPIYDALTIADEIDQKLGEIALEEMRRANNG